MAKKPKKGREPKWSTGSCMHALNVTFPNGGVSTLIVGCEGWACPQCKRTKLEDCIQHLRRVSGLNEWFGAELPIERWAAVSKMARREGVDWLYLKRQDVDKRTKEYPPGTTVVIVASAPLEGRGWVLKPIDAPAIEMLALEGPISRRGWSDNWRPPKRESRGSIGRVSCPISWLPEVRALAGFDESLGVIPGATPEETVVRFQEATDLVRARRDAEQAVKVGKRKRGRSK